MTQFYEMVYRCPGHHQAFAGQTYDYRDANSEDELKSLLDAGWHLTLVDAVNAALGQADREEDDAQPTREELEAKATELGIKFDGRTSDAGLLKKINAVMQEGSD